MRNAASALCRSGSRPSAGTPRRDRRPRRIRAAPQAAPDAGLGPLLQQVAPFHSAPASPSRARAPAARRAWAARRPSRLPRGIGHRTLVTGRLAARTERGAQVHRGPGYAGHVQVRRHFDLRVGQRPQALFDLARLDGSPAMPKWRVNTRLTLPSGSANARRRQRRRWRRRGAADPRQGGDGFGRGREAALPVARDFLCAAVQVAGARACAGRPSKASRLPERRRPARPRRESGPGKRS